MRRLIRHRASRMQCVRPYPSRMAIRLREVCPSSIGRADQGKEASSEAMPGHHIFGKIKMLRNFSMKWRVLLLCAIIWQIDRRCHEVWKPALGGLVLEVEVAYLPAFDR